MTAVVCEPACGKGNHDAMGGVAKRYISDAIKQKRWVPNCLEAFKICREEQPKNAERFKAMEKEEDVEGLKKEKKK